MCYINVIRGSFLLIAVMFTAIKTSYSQNYNHSPNDTIIADAVFNDINLYNIFQNNQTQEEVSFKWHLQSAEIPATWEATTCDNSACYPVLKDSGMMDPVLPGQDGFLSVHINPKSETGTAIVRYAIFAANTPELVDTLTWIISASGTTGFANPAFEEPVIGINEQGIICRNLGGSYSAALLYDGNGRLLARKNITGNEIDIPLKAHSTGLFILQLKGRQTFIKKILKH